MSDPIAALIEQHTGIDCRTLGTAAYTERVARHRQELGASSETEHARRLKDDPTALQRLVATLVVHETWYFRYPAAFESLASHAAAAWRSSGGRTLRFLSLACSTGEEPYSIAMALREAGLPPRSFQIVASDVSAAAIAIARAGVYGPRSVRALSPARLERWFDMDEGRRRVREELRQPIQFGTANLKDLAPTADEERYDAIFCRNVLIYLTDDTRSVLQRNLHAALRPLGLLFLGHAEMGVIRQGGWKAIDPPEAFAAQRLASAEQPSPNQRAQAPAVGTTRAPTAVRTISPIRSGPASTVPISDAATAIPAAVPAPELEPAPLRAGRGTARVQEALRLADLGELNEAMRLLTTEREAGRISADLFYALATVQSAAGKDEGVEASLTRALYLDPDHYGALVHMALIAEARGDGSRGQRLRERADGVGPREAIRTKGPRGSPMDE